MDTAPAVTPDVQSVPQPPPIPTQQRKKDTPLWILFVILLLGSGYGFYLAARDQGWLPSKSAQAPTNFEECSQLKDSIIQESYPAVCVIKSGQRFTQVITSPTPDPIVDWMTYINTKYHYSISMPATVKTQVQAAGAGEQAATPNSDQIFMYDQPASEPYLERYLEIVPMGQVVDLPVGQWQKTDVMINGILAARFEDPDPQTFVVYRLAIPNTPGELEIYVTKDTQRVALANQILSTFKFTN